MRNRILSLTWCLALALLAIEPVWAQRIQIPQNPVTETYFQQGSVTTSPLAPVPQPSPQYSPAPAATLGQPRFDPYATNPNAASQPPSLLSPSSSLPSGTATTPFWQTPSNPQVGFTQPTYAQPGFVPPNYAQPGYPQTVAPQTVAPQTSQVPSPTFVPGAYPQQPQVLFPNGLNMPNWNLPQAQPGPYLRLFQDVRITNTWLNGGSGTDAMGMNDVEVATTVNFPNFLYLGQPLRVSPGFIFHSWEGPATGVGPPAFPTEMPARAYSTYLDFGWQPMLTPQFGADIDFSMGVYSDFESVTTDSLRFQGTGLFVLGLTPTVAIKAGVTYLDRVDIKLLPAGGILWRPNPQTRFDIYFPKPKLAQYLTTVGNTDIWWYVNGEYGGGSWTVSRTGYGGDPRVDINDIRVGGGLEWTHQNGVRGFVEAAYVFNRQLVFADGPPWTHDLNETVMVRGGLVY